jgi:diacylglycerol kinase (ATP)
LRVTLMHNPGAGDEDHGREDLIQAIEAAGHEVTWRSPADEGWEEALEEPVDLVVVAGGDGTVRKVFRRLAGSDVLVTLLPLGSANNIATALGVDGSDIERLVRGWQAGDRLSYAIGHFKSPAWEDSFVETVGGGIFAQLLARGEETEADPSGEEKVMVGLRLLREVLAEEPARPWALELDGEDFSSDLLAVEVMNIGITGPGLPLVPRADPGDHRLDVVIVPPDAREALVGYVEARLGGRPAELRPLPVRRAVRVVLTPPEGAAIRLDDEFLSHHGDRGWNGQAAASVGDRLQLLVPAT